VFEKSKFKHQQQQNDDDGPAAPASTSNIADFTPLRGNAWSIFKETLESKRFWRFLVVCLITLNVRMIFRHLDATFPKYMVREFGERVPKGTIYSINPALIIILVPLVTAATSKVDPLLMIHHGSYISAASVFLHVVSTSIWSSVAFVIVLSIGEAVWSPRLYDYTMSVSKEGREGTYGALSSAPLFLAKLPVGVMSGYLLKSYCPEEGPRDSKTMWLIIGLTTAISPVLMTVFWKYISYKDHDEDIQYTELHVQVHAQNRSVDDNSDSKYLDGT
jgi:Na+/melibiose symporter-like transporter